MAEDPQPAGSLATRTDQHYLYGNLRSLTHVSHGVTGFTLEVRSIPEGASAEKKGLVGKTIHLEFPGPLLPDSIDNAIRFFYEVPEKENLQQQIYDTDLKRWYT